jgi:hypothetical protein
MANDILAWVADIFDPGCNPFAPKPSYDNIEDAEIIEEVCYGKD